MKGCSTFLIIREMKIKTMRYLIPVIWLSSKRQQITNAGADVKRWKCKLVQPLRKISIVWRFHTKLKQNQQFHSWVLLCCPVTKLCLILCNPMNCSMPAFPIPHYLLEFAQPQVHGDRDAIQPSHPQFPPSPFAFNLSQHQDLFSRSLVFTSGGQSVRTSASASVLPMNIQG